MKASSKNSTNSGAKGIAQIAVMAATITGGKLALSFVPFNIEIVTLLCALYGYNFGRRGVFAAYIFVLCEPLMSQFGTWVISYLIYWPLVACVFWLLKKFGAKNKAPLTLAAALLTIFFGLLTSLVDVGLFAGVTDNFWLNFSIYYLRGTRLYIIHIACNIACFLFGFHPLSKRLECIAKTNTKMSAL